MKLVTQKKKRSSRKKGARGLLWRKLEGVAEQNVGAIRLLTSGGIICCSGPCVSLKWRNSMLLDPHVYTLRRNKTFVESYVSIQWRNKMLLGDISFYPGAEKYAVGSNISLNSGGTKCCSGSYVSSHWCPVCCWIHVLYVVPEQNIAGGICL